MAYLFALYSRGKYCEVCDHIRGGQFDERYYSDLKQLWYEAKYAEDQRRKKKPLNPVEKFRLRKKFKPPLTIWDGQKVIYNFRDCDRQVGILGLQNRMFVLEQRILTWLRVDFEVKLNRNGIKPRQFNTSESWSVFI